MPTETFFRLPEEKRLRLLDAAWEEFTAVSFSDASINRIIRGANIPRGSFYQYFSGKEELFAYLLSDLRARSADYTRAALRRCGGDIFATCEQTFDELFQQSGTDERLRRCVKVFRLNRNMDARCIFYDGPEELFACVRGEMDLSRFPCADERHLEALFSLLGAALLRSMMAALLNPAQTERERVLLREQILMIRLGSEAILQEKKECAE